MTADVSPPARRGWRDTFTPDRYDAVLGLLVAMLVTVPFVRSSYVAAAILTVLVFAATLGTVVASAVPLRGWHVAAAVVAAVAVVVLSTATSDTAIGRGVAALAIAVILAVGPPLILRRIFQHPTITVQDIFAALCVYLQTGLAFAFLYAAIDTFRPMAFLDPGVTERASDYVYFSFVTMLTIGYGDLVPATDAGRMMVIVQALVGQILLVVLVAYLVGAIVNRTSGTD